MSFYPLIGQAQPGGLETLLIQLAPFAIIILIFWFIVIRPAQRKQQALERLLAALKKGDKVVTNGGIFGEVVKAEGPVVVLKIADNVRIRVRRSAIAGLADDGDARSS